MADREWTFEEVDKHVQSADLSQFQGSATRGISVEGVTGTVQDLAGKLCPIYTTARPILMLLKGLPLIPQKWRDVIKTLVQILDGVCPDAAK